MKILVDEDLPQQLRRWIPGHSLTTVQRRGWKGMKNGPLLRLAETEFDVLLTGDQNLRYQQNLKGRRIAILVLPGNRRNQVEGWVPRIIAALEQIKPGQYVELPK